MFRKYSCGILPTFAISILLGSLVACQNPTTSTTGSPPVQQAPSISSLVDSIATSEVSSSGLPGMAVAIGRSGTVVYAQGYGVADLGSRTPVQPRTVFQIGSITKQFTAAAIMQLQAAGKLNVDDPVAAYLIGYGFSPVITIRMLLNHTSGLYDYTKFPAYQSTWQYYGVSQGTVITAIAQAPLDFVPGTFFEYSNSNYFVLGTIIELVSGLSYPYYISANLFTPAGLQSTYYDLPPT